MKTKAVEYLRHTGQAVQQSVEQHGRQIADAAAYSGVIATLMGWLPAIAALFSIVWIAMQMVEKVTGRKLHEMLRGLCRRFTRKP